MLFLCKELLLLVGLFVLTCKIQASKGYSKSPSFPRAAVAIVGALVHLLTSTALSTALKHGPVCAPDTSSELHAKGRAFPGGASGKEPACQCRRCKRHGFSPWVREIPWRRAWPPTPIFLPGKSHGQRRLAGYSP